MVKDRKAGGGGSSGGSNSGGGGGGQQKKKKASGDADVVILTDENFKEEVINSELPILVEFYAPWCGHCQRLEPEWNEAASELKEKTGGKVRLGKLDATVHQSSSQQYGVQGFPTIKVFGSDKFNPTDYNGGRSASDIVAAGMELFESVRDPPELRQLVDQEVFDDKCNNAQLCLIFAIPHILDDQAAQRNERLDLIRGLTEKYKARQWEWFWTEASPQEQLEDLLGVG